MLFRRHVGERAVAQQAAREELFRRLEMERVDHLPKLLQRDVAPDVERARRPEVVEQVAVSGEQNAILDRGAAHQLGIGRRFIVGRVEAERAQPAGQSAEHHVGEKSRALHRGAHDARQKGGRAPHSTKRNSST